MERLIERVCRLEIDKQTVATCVRMPGRRGPCVAYADLRDDSRRTHGAARLAGGQRGDSSRDGKHEGVLEVRVFYLLEEPFTCLLVNAIHVKQVPGAGPTCGTASGLRSCWSRQGVGCHRCPEKRPSTAQDRDPPVIPVGTAAAVSFIRKTAYSTRAQPVPLGHVRRSDSEFEAIALHFVDESLAADSQRLRCPLLIPFAAF
jgi:hypothetical protein